MSNIKFRLAKPSEDAGNAHRMSNKARLFFSPLGYIIYLLLRIYASLGGKTIVYGYRNRDGRFLRRCRIASTALISDRKKLNIGDNVWINHYVRIDTTGNVEIGEGCQIGYGSCILSHSSHVAIRMMGEKYMDYEPYDRIGYIVKPISIGAYTFIGGGSYIMPGVKIGKGCVVGVNSVVNKDIPDYTIVAGSPARIIGSTIDLDSKFLSNTDPINTDMYYDKELIQSIMENNKQFNVK